MTQYSNLDLTQREIVQGSLEQIEALIEAIEALEEDTKAARNTGAIDYITNQAIDMQLSVFHGSKINLETERVRLTDILASGTAE